MAIIFDGYAVAAQKEVELQQKVADLKKQGVNLSIASILFAEDQGSVLYTQFKKEAARRVGIDYQVYQFSMRESIKIIMDQIQKLNHDPQITGIIIQKPWRQTWQDVMGKSATAFNQWWQNLTQSLNPEKDVDGLHPATLIAIKDGTWQKQGKVLPATCAAVLNILQTVQVPATAKYIILGKSDLLGQPLFYFLQSQGKNVEMIGSVDLAIKIAQGIALQDADVIVSATGRPGLITGDLIKSGAIVIDVGEPRPDAEMSTVAQKASFITPVPGGVGPMTVVCLMENCLGLRKFRLAHLT